jgi:hypothetical protein
MNRWPWITMLLAAVVALNPLGLDIVDAAFFSGEQLSRSIWRPIAIAAGLVLLLLIALEWWVRKRRAARGAT